MSDQVSVCEFIEPLLGDYADGEVVSAAGKAEIETHLNICARCASEVAFLRATNFVLSSSFPDVQPPPDLFVRTALATYRRPTLRARIAGWLAPTPIRVGLGSALAAAVIVAVVVPIVPSKRAAKENLGLAINEPRVPSPALPEKSGVAASAHFVASASVAAVKTPNEAESYLAALPAVKTAPAADSDAIRSGRKATRELPREISTVQMAKRSTPAATRNMPAVINRLKLGRLVIPDRREAELSMRGRIVRTLPNGDLPKEFLVPKSGVPIEEAPAPARIAPLTSPAAIETGVEPSSARSVIEPPKLPQSFRLTLGGAGTGAPIVGSVPTKIASSASDGASRNFPGFVNSGF